MMSYIIKRFLSLLPTLFVPLLLIFFMLRLAPGDPASIMLGADATVEQVEQLREKMGLNEPLLIQLFAFLKQLVTLDLGDSIFLKKTCVDGYFGSYRNDPCTDDLRFDHCNRDRFAFRHHFGHLP